MNYLRLALLACAANTALSHVVAPKKTSATCRRTKVAVLGAGIAGITATVSLIIAALALNSAKYEQQALHNNSVTDFLIVEYKGEIGWSMQERPYRERLKASLTLLN